ncbi:sulfurtransferase-like selenium metabolism protein YedF [bacterium]|nr:sulfurtransferase-like selenium metabolism protein YedF [bacterium]
MIVIQLANDGMGRGDEELGKRLMTTFLQVLGQADQTVAAMVLFNTGVRLACEGSPVLQELKELEERGTMILSCGTCLNHFDLGRKLVVGKASNMVEITDTMLKAEKVIPL